MNLVTVDTKTYHLDSTAVDTEKKTVIICRSCYISLAHSLNTGKPPLQTFAFYDYGVIPARLPKLSLAEQIATSRNIVLQVIKISQKSGKVKKDGSSSVEKKDYRMKFALLNACFLCLAMNL